MLRATNAMKSLNNEFFTLIIFYLCATSLVAATNATTTPAMPSRADKIMLLPVSSSTSLKTEAAAAATSLHINNNYADERNVPKEASLAKGDLHLDEYNFVATTPKIQTTKAPSR